MGVFEIADEQRETIYIGHAGGDSPFGLRGELFRLFGFPPGSEDWNWKHPHPEGIPTELRERARYYRYEVNHQYYSRWIETLTRYREDFGGAAAAQQRSCGGAAAKTGSVSLEERGRAEWILESATSSS